MATIRVKKLPSCPECDSTNRRVFRYRGLGDLLRCDDCKYLGAPNRQRRVRRPYSVR